MMITSEATYPGADRQGKSYFVRLSRALFNSGAVAEIGPRAALLVHYVASCEDRLFYKRPVGLWNEQLFAPLGLHSPKDVIKARTAAVDAGWLHYHRKGDCNRSQGIYWTTIPEGLDALANLSLEGTNQGTNKPSITSLEGTSSGTNQGTSSGTNQGTNQGTPPYLDLEPVKPRPRPNKHRVCVFVAPALPDVQSFWNTSSLKGSAEEFFDHYTANGWTQGRQSKPMKDWHAAARNWSRRNDQFSTRSSFGSKRSANVGPGVKFQATIEGDSNVGKF